MHRRRACVVFWKKEGRERELSTLSKEEESKRCRRRSGGRVFEKRIQTPKGALISPPLAPARRSHSSLRTRAGWAPNQRRCPVARWTSRLSLLFSFSPLLPSVSFRLSLSREQRSLSHAESVCCLLWLLLLLLLLDDADWKAASAGREEKNALKEGRAASLFSLEFVRAD